MTVISLVCRLERIESKIPPKPVSREEIEHGIQMAGLDVNAVWRYVVAENPAEHEIMQLAESGQLEPAVDKYNGMSGGYRMEPL